MRSDRSDLETEFDALMMSIYRRAKAEAGYTATIFLRMLDQRGGVETAKFLLRESQVSSGFVALWERKRLDLTVEAQLLANPQYWPLFEERDLDTARRWLKEYGYQPSTH
jgi:hypothetical protein